MYFGGFIGVNPMAIWLSLCALDFYSRNQQKASMTNDNTVVSYIKLHESQEVYNSNLYKTCAVYSTYKTITQDKVTIHVTWYLLYKGLY